jgi:hypothetical protein
MVFLESDIRGGHFWNHEDHEFYITFTTFSPQVEISTGLFMATGG